MLFRAKMVAALAAGLIASTSAFAGAIIEIDNAASFSYCDDCYVGPVDIGFDINFFGSKYSQLYVNKNGYISFNSGYYDYTFGSLSSSVKAVIAPFFGDVSGKSTVTYGKITYEGHTAFAASWINASLTISPAIRPEPLNSFQALLVDRSDVGTGDFDFIFNFDSIQWNNNYKWDTSFMGYGANGNYYGYTTNNTLNGNQLPYKSINSDVAGRYVFEVRNGVVTNPLPLVPEPETYAMLLVGLGVVTGVARRRAKITG